MIERNILIGLVLFSYFFVAIPITLSQPCDSCSNTCTISCNDPQSHWDEIPDGDSYYFTYTLDSESMVIITMTPDPTGDGGPDYDLYTSWTADECYQWMSDCGVPSGGDVEEICSPLSPLPAGTYYFQVEHWSDVGNGFYLELDCETTTSTTTSTSTTSTSTSTTSTSTSSTTTSVTTTTSTSTATTTSSTSTTTSAPVCGNGLIDIGEDCDIGIGLPDDPDNACESWEYCDSNCQCHDFSTEMLGCDFYDWCDNGVDPDDPGTSCQWGEHCYSQTADGDPDYRSVIESLCDDASHRNHTWRQQCKFI